MRLNLLVILPLLASSIAIPLPAPATLTNRNHNILGVDIADIGTRSLPSNSADPDQVNAAIGKIFGGLATSTAGKTAGAEKRGEVEKRQLGNFFHGRTRGTLMSGTMPYNGLKVREEEVKE